jgi:hypothetical protein
LYFYGSLVMTGFGYTLKLCFHAPAKYRARHNADSRANVNRPPKIAASHDKRPS